MNEPFNILVVTNSRRQATQKTQTEFFICFYCWSFVQAERDRRQGAGGKEHRTQDMRAVGSWNGQAISECRPEQSRIDKVNESLATYLATRVAEAASASRCYAKVLLVLHAFPRAQAFMFRERFKAHDRFWHKRCNKLSAEQLQWVQERERERARDNSQNKHSSAREGNKARTQPIDDIKDQNTRAQIESKQNETKQNKAKQKSKQNSTQNDQKYVQRAYKTKCNNT